MAVSATGDIEPSFITSAVVDSFVSSDFFFRLQKKTTRRATRTRTNAAMMTLTKMNVDDGAFSPTFSADVGAFWLGVGDGGGMNDDESPLSICCRRLC